LPRTVTPSAPLGKLECGNGVAGGAWKGPPNHAVAGRGGILEKGDARGMLRFTGKFRNTAGLNSELLTLGAAAVFREDSGGMRVQEGESLWEA